MFNFVKKYEEVKNEIVLKIDDNNFVTLTQSKKIDDGSLLSPKYNIVQKRQIYAQGFGYVTKDFSISYSPDEFKNFILSFQKLEIK